MTELPGPNAQIHGHSEGTVKLAKAHCDSTYCPRKLIFDNLANRGKNNIKPNQTLQFHSF